MDDIISIDKLTYSYTEEFILYNICLKIKRGDWVTIAGSNASGKSTLIKILCGLIKVEDDIIIDNIKLNKENLYSIRSRIGVVFENPDNSFICETVKDDISMILRNLNCNELEIDEKLYNISKLLKIDDILEFNAHKLSGGEKQRVALACALVHEPKILLLDEAFCMMSYKERKEILEVLSDIRKEKNMTIINVTHDLEESFYSNRLIVLNKGEILLDGSPKKVMSYDKVFGRVGIEIPFVVDLSIKLKLYGLLDDIFFDMDELVNYLWK